MNKLSQFGLGFISTLLAQENANKTIQFEKEKQLEFCSGSLFPISNLPLYELEKEGFIFGNFIDKDFIEVIIPEGWKLVPSKESTLNSILIDKDGIERVYFSHKYNHYDRWFNCSKYQTDKMIEIEKELEEIQNKKIEEQNKKIEIHNSIVKLGSKGNKFIYDIDKNEFINEHEFVYGESHYIFIFAFNKENAIRKLNNYLK
jgi:hypothetical protein